MCVCVCVCVCVRVCRHNSGGSQVLHFFVGVSYYFCPRASNPRCLVKEHVTLSLSVRIEGNICHCSNRRLVAAGSLFGFGLNLSF